MSDYGAHPTQYGNLSDGNLYAMYRESVYRSLSESQKLDLLQETVNRDAAARGEVGSPKVRFENLPSGTDGYAEKGVISVNRDLAVNGTRTATYQGKTLQHRPSACYGREGVCGHPDAVDADLVLGC